MKTAQYYSGNISYEMQVLSQSQKELKRNTVFDRVGNPGERDGLKFEKKQ